MTKHTPLAWKAIVTDDGELIIHMEGSPSHNLLIGDMESTCGECHANARLIAAAPNLLAACEAALLDGPSFEVRNILINAIDAAKESE